MFSGPPSQLLALARKAAAAQALDPRLVIRNLPNAIPLPAPITLQADHSPSSIGPTLGSPATNTGDAPVGRASPARANREKPALDRALLPAQDLKPLYDFAPRLPSLSGQTLRRTKRPRRRKSQNRRPHQGAGRRRAHRQGRQPGDALPAPLNGSSSAPPPSWLPPRPLISHVPTERTRSQTSRCNTAIMFSLLSEV
jgi:hypothetical protein